VVKKSSLYAKPLLLKQPQRFFCSRRRPHARPRFFSRCSVQNQCPSALYDGLKFDRLSADITDSQKSGRRIITTMEKFMKPVAPISGVSTSSSLDTIALLQAQMLRYSLMANSAIGAANIDYMALQNAIKSGNVSEAQAALSRLQHDSQAASSNSPSSSSITNSSPTDGGGDHDGNTGTLASPGVSLNETA